MLGKWCVNRIHLWPLRRDDHSGVLIGAGGTRRPDWPARVLANYESIDNKTAGASGSQLLQTGLIRA